MSPENIVLANASAEALELHDERTKHSVITNTYTCPRCGRSKLISEVLEINEGGYRYDINVKCGRACGVAVNFSV